MVQLHCVCNPSIAELPRLKTFISVNFQLFDQNSALLQRCIYFSSLNSPPSFLSSSWFGRFLFRLNLKRCYVWCDTIQFETEKNKVGLWVVTKETDAVLKALCLSILSYIFLVHLLIFFRLSFSFTTNWHQNVCQMQLFIYL